MKLVIHIPCLNEEATLPLVLRDLPKEVPGIDDIEVLVTDDGSTDDTIKVAREHGVRHFVRHTRNQGLGQSFHDGVMKALDMGADIVVNTDGDNQYPGDRIARLVQPIIKGDADIVIGDRQTHKIEHFSWTKKQLQRIGSAIVNKAAGTKVPDAVSGFRAYSRDSLMRLNTITRFSYCTETIIQAGNKGLHIESIVIDANPPTRQSRLFNSTFEHVRKSAITIIRAYVMYKPYIIFGWLGGVMFAIGLIPFARFIIVSLDDGTTSGHIQSLLIGSLLMIAAFLCLVLNIIADLIRTNRILTEDALEQVKRQSFNHKN
ncbi:MAG TPA: glycosyltransferase family 2 protein [Candidatus Saccharimonadia bacterium]|nr:glycosyltransferase family 2 protein [Candidatus Saccharimonadia bacterium]